MHRIRPLTGLQWLALAALLLAAAAARAVFLYNTSPGYFSPDEVGYIEVARQYLANGILGYRSPFPNAFITPGYPLFVSFFYWLAEITNLYPLPLLRGGHLLLSVGMVALVFAIGRRLGSNFIAFTAAIIAAFSKQLIYVNMRILTETLYTFLLLLYTFTVLGWLKQKKWQAHALSGAVFALTVLVRPAVLPVFIIPYFLALVDLTVRRRAGKSCPKAGEYHPRPGEYRSKAGEYRLKAAEYRSLVTGFVVAVLFFSAVMSPWWVRNYVALGQVVLTATQSGDPFLRGTDPYDPYDRKGPSIMKDVPEEKMFAVGVERVKEGLREDPVLWIKWFTVGKLQWLWGVPWPFAPPYKISRWLHYIVLFFGFIGAFLALRRPLFDWVAAIVFFFTLLQLAFIPIPRYMFPLAPFMFLLTAFCWQQIYRYVIIIWEKRKKQKPLFPGRTT